MTTPRILFSQLCITVTTNPLHQPTPTLLITHILPPFSHLFSSENVLVLRHPDANGQVVCKLLDFGLSKNAGGGSAAKTFVGTPCYLAPEVEYTSKGLGGTYGLPADCWSLGAVLYVMLVARFPEFEQDITGKVSGWVGGWVGDTLTKQNISFINTHCHILSHTSINIISYPFTHPINTIPHRFTPINTSTTPYHQVLYLPPSPPLPLLPPNTTSTYTPTPITHITHLPITPSTLPSPRWFYVFLRPSGTTSRVRPRTSFAPS